MDTNDTSNREFKFLDPHLVAQQDNRNATLVEIDEELRLLLSPIHVQINSPQRIDATLFQPFLHPVHAFRKEILLVASHNRTVVPAILDSVNDTYLVANTRRAMMFYIQQDKVLLVVFPVLPKQHYVLQTQVDALYLDQLRLRYLDPRSEVRWKIQLATPVFIRLVPQALIAAIAYRQVRILRELTLPQWNGQGSQEGQIADLFYQLDASVRSPYMSLFEESPPLSCKLKDISLGGVCLTLEGDYQPEEFLYRLVLLYISFPRVTADGVDQESMPFTLRPLSVIRAVKTSVRPWTLHIRFLKRLPEEFGPLLECLERRH